MSIRCCASCTFVLSNKYFDLKRLNKQHSLDDVGIQCTTLFRVKIIDLSDYFLNETMEKVCKVSVARISQSRIVHFSTR